MANNAENIIINNLINLEIFLVEVLANQLRNKYKIIKIISIKIK